MSPRGEASPLRVLHVVSGDLYAGAERIAEELVIAQRSHLGCAASVAILNDGQLNRALRAAGVPTEVFDESRNGALVLWQGLHRLIRQLRPDVVHTHRFKENILGAFAAGSQVPSIRTVHGAPEFARKGSLRHRIIAGLDRITATHFQKRVVCVSAELAEKMGDLYDRRTLDVVVNGIDPSRVRQAATVEVPRLGGELRVGVFARLVPVKRIHLALDCVASARKRLDRDLVLHVFGDGPLDAELRARAAAYGSEVRAVFHGNTLQAPAFMRQMDAVLMTSSHEGLPVTLLEAMSLSVPIVATRTGGVPDVLAHGDCGWLVDEGTAEGYATALLDAIAPSSMRASKIAGALKRVEDEFSARRMAMDYASVYHSVLRGSHGVRREQPV